MDKLPVYEMVIDENPESEVEVSFIALVDKPAIEKNFLAFNSQKLEFKIEAARQIISGPAMVPDTNIYRRDAGGEYNVFFSKDTIEKIALKFFKQDYQKNLNLFHDPTLSLQGVTIFESFVSDKARGVQPMKGFEDLPDGTWFISAKVENPDVWAKIQTGEVKGFSVEGIFSYVKKPKKKKGKYEEELAEAIAESRERVRAAASEWFASKPVTLLNRTIEEEGLIEEIDDIMLKDLVARIKKELFDGTPMPTPVAQAAPAPQAPAAPAQALNVDYQLKDGTPIQVDKLEIGGTALINGMPAPAGEHELQDGTKITVGEGGIITLVTPGVMATAPALSMADVELAINNAITKYKEEMAAQAEQAMTRLIKEATDKQDTKFKGLFEIIEALTVMPTAEPIEQGHQSFTKEKVTSQAIQRQILVDKFKKLKTA